MQMCLEGQTQHRIAEALGISQPAVSKILRRMEERLLADVSTRVERQRARHTMRLEFIYGEAVRAWQASKEDGVRRRQRKSEGGVGREGSSIAEIVSESRHGDPRYLESARRALEDLRRLWGVDPPERLAVTDGSPFATMSDTTLEAELARLGTLVRTLTAPSTQTAEASSDAQPRDHDE